MKTNVTIRIDDDLVQRAKELDLNLSKIAENALFQAVEEESKPYGIVETSQIIYEASIFYSLREKILIANFTVINASAENVISDRINYSILITDREVFTELPIWQSLQQFKGSNLERQTIPTGQRRTFAERLTPSPELATRLAEMTFEDNKNLGWVVYPGLFVETRKQVLFAKFEQIVDDKKRFLLPRPLKTF